MPGFTYDGILPFLSKPWHRVLDLLDRSATTGELTPEFEQGDVSFRPVEDVLSMTDGIRDSDRERIEMAVDATR